MTAALHLADRGLLDRHDLTVDDLDSLPEDLRYELIDGRLVLTPQALPSHQLLSLRIASALEQHCPDDFIVNQEQALLLNGRNELVPDVMLIRASGSGRSPVHPADVPLVVEIISRSSRLYDREDKLKRYAGVGIPLYWIIDPLADRVTFTQFVLGPDAAYQCDLQTDRLITLHRPWETTLDLPSWTRRRDSLRDAARD